MAWICRSDGGGGSVHPRSRYAFKHFQGMRADLGLFFIRQRILIVAVDGPPGLDRPVEQAHIAGDMNDRHHQRRHIGMLERFGNEGVVFGDGGFRGFKVNRHYSSV